MTEYRAHFDAVVEFANGGGLTAEGFRLDLPGRDADVLTVGRLFVQHLGLALVSAVTVSNLSVVEEQHRGSRGVEVPAAAETRGRIVDLSHVIRDGLITYPGLPAPVITIQPASAIARPKATACSDTGWPAGMRAEPNTVTFRMWRNGAKTLSA